MKNANYNDKESVLDILTKSFEANRSVNYIVIQDKDRIERIRFLMNYSFEVCSLFGEVFISEDKKACALIIYPDKKATTIKSMLLDVKLIFKCVGLKNVRKTIDREKQIKRNHPTKLLSYLWFIGVDPEFQNHGIGSKLLKEIVEYSIRKNRPIYLETSTLKILPWYEKMWI